MKESESINQYQQIVDAFVKLGSIVQVVERLHVSEVKVRRVLISEGLWSSRTSRQIAAFMERGLSAQEIAAGLHTTLKAVEAYMPYRRGIYDEISQSNSAARSERYRRRKELAAQNQVWHGSDSAAHASRKEASHEERRDNMMTANKLYDEVTGKTPRVLKIHLELEEDLQDRTILSTYGKSTDAISRDVLVPADITLHALHYVIQRLFGWQNSHLHHFELPGEVQTALLSSLGQINGRPLYSSWEKLCGIYYRFPTEDMEDVYWDDDYEGEVSFKSWMRRKYTAPYSYDGFSEHYLECKICVAELRKKYSEIPVMPTFSEYLSGDMEPQQRMVPIDEVTVREMDGFMEYQLSELLERVPLIDLIFPRGAALPDNWAGQIKAIIDDASKVNAGREKSLRKLRRAIAKAGKLYETDEVEGLIEYNIAMSDYKRFVTAEEPKPMPLSDTLHYLYDYGDGWQVNIRCDDVFYISDGHEAQSGSVPAVNEKASQSAQVDDRSGKPVEAKLLDQATKVIVSKRPVCIDADGLSVMDDVGGIYGYCDFLSTIHEGSDTEREEMKTWAGGMGWTGRKSKPENML